MKLIYRLNIKILRFLNLFPRTREPVNAFIKYLEIKSLEKKGEYEEARRKRSAAILTIKTKYQGPILRSEGYDKLYRLSDYEGAIRAFEKAEIAMEGSPFLYGVSEPHSVISGVAIAAVYSGDIEKATVYRDKLSEMYERWKKEFPSSDSLKWFDKTITWINNAINANKAKDG